MHSVLVYALLACLLHYAAADCTATGKKKVLLIGLDGTRGDILQLAMQRGLAPTFAALASRAQATTCASPTDAHCASAHSGNRFGSVFPANSSDWLWVTSPGWCSVLTGVDNYKHRVGGNNLLALQFIETSKQYPTLFTRARKLGLVTAASGSDGFFGTVEEPIGIVDLECGLPPIPTANTSCNLDYRVSHSGNDDARDAKTTMFAIQHVQGDPITGQGCADVVMAHYDKIDASGHACGFGDNACYLSNITAVDGHVAELLAVINKMAAARQESWLVMVTADHGGHTVEENGLGGGDHGTRWFEDEVVPFMVTTVTPAAAGIFAPAPVRLNPLKAPVKHYDVMPTVMAWLGVSVKGQGIDGQVQGVSL